MPNGDLPQGMYTPIPQNMTDSDSEEELHLQSSVRSMRSSQQSTTASTATMVSNRFNEQRSSVTDVRFSSGFLENHSDGDDKMGHHPHEADNVAILNTNLRKGQPMSSLRKMCFIVSIFVCLLTIVYFVWVLPCSDGDTCSADTEHIQTHNWLSSYERIELKGMINVVRGVRGRSMNLVFMYRGNKIFPTKGEPHPTITKQNGIISLMGNSGEVAWYDEMKNEPSVIDCTLIDADNNGESDCLVIDEFGEIGCINPVSGQWLWHVAQKTSVNPDILSFPLIVPDLDNDFVKDLLTVYSENNATYNSLKFISGRTGRMVGHSYTVSNCTYIHKFQLEKNLKIYFNCIKNDTESRVSLNLSQIYTLLTNSTLDIKFDDNNEMAQHKFYGQRKDTIRQRNIYTVINKKLIVENYGICPDACNVSVTLQEKEENGKIKIIRNFNGSRMYGMVPARLSFKKSSDPTKTAVHGFVIKFWEWGQNHTAETNSTPESTNQTIANSTDFNKFDNILRKKRAWNLPNTKVSQPIVNLSTNAANILIQMRLIKETVVLIVFNSTDIRIENTSQNNIIQFCSIENNNTANEKIVCQPDLNYQENSVLIADLDQDGSQELVSYYSTFTDVENERNKWKLMTYVQLLRLESELPKLYSIEKLH